MMSVMQLKYVDASAAKLNDPTMRNTVFKARVIGYAMKSGTMVITVKMRKSKYFCIIYNTESACMPLHGLYIPYKIGYNILQWLGAPDAFKETLNVEQTMPVQHFKEAYKVISIINLRNLPETLCGLVERLHVNLSRHFV